MTIRTRLTFWYAAILFASLVLMSVVAYHEFVQEARDTTTQARMERGEDRDVEENDFTEISRIILWCGIPATVLALGGGWFLMRRALAPMATLAEAARRVNERNLHTPLPRTGNGDELDQLTETLNDMTRRLHDYFTRIHEFTLHASHELKTPLTILSGETETELSDEDLPAIQRNRADSRLEELRRLSRIVDGLTLLAKADAGQLPLVLAPVRFDELVRDCFGDMQILGLAKRIQVKLISCEETTMTGDASRMRQLMLNLADNAVKYNRSEGRVTLSLERFGNCAELTITNTGPGIPVEVLPRVFDRFFRGDPAHDNNIEGCGLGLSIAKWIVTAHHGTIKIESSIAAELTTVTVRLPLGQEGGA